MYYAINKITRLVESKMTTNMTLEGCDTIEFNPNEIENEILEKGGTIKDGVVIETEKSLQRKDDQYIYDRRKEYPIIQEQLDMIYKDKINGTTTWIDMITTIKEIYPKI